MPLITVKNCLNCDVAHEWVFSGPTLKELRMIKHLTGMNQKQFGEAGDEGDPEALAALLYVLHKRERITVPFEDIDLDFNDFSMEPTEEEKELIAQLEAAAEAGVEVDPKETPSGPKKKAGSKPKS